MQLKRGYLLLITGGAIVALGLASSVYYVGEFLSGIQRTGVHNIAPLGFVNIPQNIEGVQGAFFVAFPSYEEVPVIASIRITDPTGTTVIEREVDLPFYSEQFVVQNAGNYTLVISNLSPNNSLDVAAIIGDPEAISEIVGTSTIVFSAMSSFIVLAGIIMLAVGAAWTVMDWRRTQKMRKYGDISDLR